MQKRRKAIMDKLEEMLKLMRAGDRGVWASLTDTAEAWSIEKGLAEMLLGERTIYADWMPGQCFLWVSAETWDALGRILRDKGITEGDIADEIIEEARGRMGRDPEMFVAELAGAFLRGLQKHDGRYRVVITSSGPHEDAYEVPIRRENWLWLDEEVSPVVCKKAGLKEWKGRNPGPDDIFGILIEDASV